MPRVTLVVDVPPPNAKAPVALTEEALMALLVNEEQLMIPGVEAFPFEAVKLKIGA